MWLIAGLGNPGSAYAAHRHNAGFLLLDEIASVFRASSWSLKFHSEIAQTEIAGGKVLLCKPQTFMNESGRAVSAAAKFYQIEAENILVLHDELDLPLGKMRIKQGGGHGGHNGLRDIDKHIGKDYWRLRFGIGHPGDKSLVHNYVLHPFAKAEREEFDFLSRHLADELPLFFTEGHEAFMTRFALLTAKETDKENKKEKKDGV